ncbi:hypothetical protein A3715_18300 [Oleiphilus sp. HI0009]|nr:hypothetical protein A3715_18300 [Oleiphilus sp. HI0009]
MPVNVILDIDDVLGDLASDLQKVLNEVTGKSICTSKWKTYDLYNIYGISKDEMLSLINERNLLSKIKPIAGAKSAVRLMRMNGWRIHACTNRSFHNQAEKLTFDWLDSNDMHVDTLTINNSSVVKAKAVSSLASTFDFIFDDNHNNVINSLTYGNTKKGCVITKPWSNVDIKHDNVSKHESLLGAVISVIGEA